MTGTTSQLQLGSVIASQFRIERKLGQGGMGSVFLAEQLDMGRHVVVKVLNPELTTGNQVAVERFRREAQAVAKLNHPNIVQIYVFGHTEDQQLYIAMEFVDGRDLGADVEKGVMAQPRALKILDQVCAALVEAHSTGIVHRDLKPENIMLTDRHGNPDYVKVLDFGIAKLHDSGNQPSLTQTGTVFGTPRYMAPEQARGLAVDARADIYALGLILHEMLTGHHPFKANTALDYLLQHVNEPVYPIRETHPELNVSPRVDAIVMRCLEKNADDRYQSVAELQRELRLALRDFSESSRGFPSASHDAVGGAARPRPQPRDAMAATQTAPGGAAVASKKGFPVWGWVGIGAGLAGGLVAVVLATTGGGSGPGPAGVAGPVPVDAPAATASLPPLLRERLAVATAKLEGHPEMANLLTRLATRIGKGENPETVLASLSGKDLVTLQKFAEQGGDLDEVFASFEAPGDDPDEDGAEPLETQLTDEVPTSTLQPGTPVDGFPVPAGARNTVSTPQAELFEVKAPAREIILFYRQQLQGRYPVEEIPNGLSIKSSDSPFSFVTLSANGDSFLLNLTRNVLAPETEKAGKQKDGETIFGLEIPDGCSVIVRSEQALVLRSRMALADVCAHFFSRYGGLPNVVVVNNSEADSPACVLASSNGKYEWQAVSMVPDPQSPGSVMISIAKKM
jgi:tRNA A-37 threonylcarbamoyl transferase component Bud32